MSQSPRAHTIAAALIRLSCRRLPEEMRAERYQEWSAELHAILDDRGARQGPLPALRALRYAAGIWRAARQLSPPSDGAMRARRLNLATRATAGILVWLVVISVTVTLMRAFPRQHLWTFVLVLDLAGGFAAVCLADIARAREVRYLPKWAWALICVFQVPSGGIAYLILGRVGKPRPASPRSARS
jgi:hypothetical protein